MYKCRPRFNISAREYRPDAPQEDALLREQLANVSLEPYVREQRPVPAPPLHMRIPRRLPQLTAEPPKPAVTYRDQETQTEPVVVDPAPVPASDPADLMHMCWLRNEAAELRADNSRLQREVDALTLAMKKLSVEVQATRSAEERRLAQDKTRLEQLERAEEQTRREKLERAARSAEERRLAEDSRRLELERAAEERRLAERLAEAARLEQLERDREARERLQRLLPRAQPARAAARLAKPATPAQAPVRVRTLNRAAK